MDRWARHYSAVSLGAKLLKYHMKINYKEDVFDVLIKLGGSGFR
jgi:hypothetical protein